jgi:hypothetical protein
MKRSAGTFHCFSPPVMVATMAVETALLVYTFVRYRMTPITRVIMAQLFFLAIFQLAEYSVCGRYNLEAATWSRIGYLTISTLPPFGVHLVQLVSRRGWWWVKHAAYANMAIWLAVFGTSHEALAGHVCAGNYVIFQLSDHAEFAYFSYYYFWLTATMLGAGWFAWNARGRIRLALLLQMVGYLIFLVPTTVINSLYPGTRAGIPSIMCGFAVLYVLIMVFGIIPLTRDVRGEKPDRRAAAGLKMPESNAAVGEA